MSVYTSLILSESSLINYWELQETTGVSAVDSKSANDGTYTAGFTLNQASLTDLGVSVAWNGTTSSLIIPTESIPGPLSIECWYKIASADSNQNGFIILKKPVNAQWALFFEGGLIKLRGSSGSSALSCAVPIDSNWHHLVGIITGSTGIIYLDNVQVASGSIGVAMVNGTTPTTNDLLIGNHGSGGYFFKGNLCHVALYNSLLTATQVETHYGTGIGSSFNPAARVSQTGVLFVNQGTPAARVSQTGVLYVNQGTPAARVSQTGVLFVYPVLHVSVSQTGILIINQGTPNAKISQTGTLIVNQGTPKSTISQTGLLVITAIATLPFQNNMYGSFSNLRGGFIN